MSAPLPPADSAGRDPQFLYARIVKGLMLLTAMLSMIAPVWMLATPQNRPGAPSRIFAMVLSGESREAIAQETGAGQGLRIAATADGLGQFGILFACSITLLALLPTAFLCFRNREPLYGSLCLFLIALTLFAMSGWPVGG